MIAEYKGRVGKIRNQIETWIWIIFTFLIQIIHIIHFYIWKKHNSGIRNVFFFSF